MEGLGGASKSIIPEEKVCGLCITSKCCMCVCVRVIRLRRDRRVVATTV